MTLLDARKRLTYEIIEVDFFAAKVAKRLLDMGFTPKTRIFVAAISPLKGTVLAIIRGCLVALRADAASIISVRVIQ